MFSYVEKSPSLDPLLPLRKFSKWNFNHSFISKVVDVIEEIKLNDRDLHYTLSSKNLT
jgi:hypothetical protein